MAEDYYDKGGSKVGDFLLGFIVAPIVPVGVSLAVNGPGVWVAAVALLIAGAVYAFMRGRRFIGIGILSLLLVPLLAFGACLLMLTQMKF